MNRNDQEITGMKPTAWKPDGTPTRFEIVPSEPEYPRVIGADDVQIVSPIPAQIVRSTSHIEGSWSDRARAFNLSTLNLALVTGGLFIVASIALAGKVLPLFTLALIYFAGFSVTWLIAYFLHTMISAEGAQMADTLLLWQFLAREQQERHRRAGAPVPSRGREILAAILFAAAMGVTIFCVVGLIVAVVWGYTP